MLADVILAVCGWIIVLVMVVSITGMAYYIIRKGNHHDR